MLAKIMDITGQAEVNYLGIQKIFFEMSPHKELLRKA